MKDMGVVHWHSETDGELGAEPLQHKLERAGYEVSIYTYPPGTYFPPHTHGVDKCDAVLRGRLKSPVVHGRCSSKRAI
jgi:predicted metal-dependent enzyme (double-stranded beta helix superfamily)